MSDSDSELLTTNNVFTFQNESKTVSAQGPRINVTGMSFPDHNKIKNMNIPSYEWRRRPGSSYDQRSIGYRRETSPVSIASACDARSRKFNSYYARAKSAQKSVYNDRAGSPMSMRSMDSNATMCATDIVMALKNMQFNNNDTMIIKEAFNRFMKQKSNRRSRIEKRRNLRLVKLMRSRNRRKSGYDSGELGSNSSISSDDNRSVRTSNTKSNKSCYKSTITDISAFRRTIKESHMFQDCSDNFRQKKIQMSGELPYLNSSRASVTSTKSVIEKPTFIKSMPMVNFNRTQNQNALTQKERFKNGFLLPSQRFNRSVAATSIPEGAESPHHTVRKYTNYDSNKNCGDFRQIPQLDPSSDDEELFTERSKRGIDTVDDMALPKQKKAKFVSPCKNMTQSFRSSTLIEAKNNFEFAKPAFPVKRPANLKAKEKLISESVINNPVEKLICSSRLPITDTIESSVPKPTKTISQSKEVDDKEGTGYNTIASQSMTDLSMRPSFIKRKLFSQNMDVTEKTQDIVNSPQNSIYGAIQKEKNKARKLATSQYCLSRDIQTDENNLLDLIHKIIPAEQMNATNQTTKTIQNKSQDDKWDMSSIISAKNNEDEDMSDTFTDEDILHSEQPPPRAVPLKSRPKKIVEKKSVTKNVANKVVEKNVAEVAKSTTKIAQVTQKVLAEKNDTSTKVVGKCVKSFWDTDFESDVEGAITRKCESKENTKTESQHSMEPKAKFKGFSSLFPLNKTSAANNTTMFNNTVDKLSITNRGLKLCSHRNTKPFIKKSENLKEDIRSHFESQIKKNQHTTKASSSINRSEHNNDEQSKTLLENQEPTTKKLPPKKRTNKGKCEETSQVSIVKDPVKCQKKTITKASSCINLSMKADVDQNNVKQENKKSVNNIPKPKTRKTNKENNDKSAEVTTEKKPTKPPKKTLKAGENTKAQNNRTVSTVTTKSQDKNEKKNVKAKVYKKLATAKDEREKVEEDETHQSKTQKNENSEVKNPPANNKEPETAEAQTRKQGVSAKSQNMKAEDGQLHHTANKAKITQNAKTVTNQFTLSDAMNKDSFTDSNTSIHPLRSCRISKQNERQRSLRSSDSNSQTINDIKKNAKTVTNQFTLSDAINKDSFTDSNTSIRPLRSCRISKLNETQRSLRSSDSKPSQTINDIKKIPIKKKTTSTKNVAQDKPVKANKPVNKLQQNLDESDISFSICKDSPSSNIKNKRYNTRLQSTIESDISFCINDKVSNRIKNYRRNPTNILKQAVIMLSPINKLHFQKNWMVNRRYVS